MKKRLRRKKHKAFLPDVLHDVSVSNTPAQVLVDASGQDVLLTAATMQKILPSLARDLARWNLRFAARTVASGFKPGLFFDDSRNIIFEFRAVEFPKIKNWSGNNPDRFKRPSSERVAFK
jgi:hypothetical protein